MSVPVIQDILLLHHSHLDVGYTHSQPVVWELQNEYLDQVIDWLDATSDLPDGGRPKWTCEATEPLLRWLSRASSTKVQRFVDLHRAGRLGVSALRWHTTGLPDRAGLKRLLNGKSELENLLGTKILVACQHDVNGVSWPMADVLLDAGVDLLVMAINIHLGRAVQPRPGMFLWEAPSGRRLRVFNGNHYTMFDQLLYAWDDSVDRMAQGWADLAERLRASKYPLDFVYLTSTCSPIMWDNAPSNPYLPALITRWNESGHKPPVRYATFDDLRLRALGVPDAALRVMRGDWTDYWNFGTGSAPTATSRNQRAKALIEATEAIADPSIPVNPMLDRAMLKVDLYDEHTFGYYDSDHSNPMAQTTELLKHALAHEGNECAAFALMDGLERLAQNPVADRGFKAVLLCNPGPAPLVVYPELPDSWFAAPHPASDRTYRASRMFHAGRSWEAKYPGPLARVFAPTELAPYSWKCLPLSDLQPAENSSELKHCLDVESLTRRELNFAPVTAHRRRLGRIESPYHALSYDPDSGRITSLVDKANQREVLTSKDGMDLFAFVRERTDALAEGSRYAFYQRDLDREKVDELCWKDWEPIRERATRVTYCHVSQTPKCITLTRHLDAPGLTHLVQRFSLFARDPVIQMECDLELIPQPSPQSVYFVLPLQQKSGWQAAFDTAGAVVRVDADQLPGACRNWVPSATFSAIWDSQSGVALFTPDAPLVQFGDFHFGRPLDSLPRPENPLLLAWPLNNYWDTNFPRVQAGRLCLRYGLLTFGNADLDAIRARAQTFRQPPLTWPVTTQGRGAGEGRLR